jgi:hypothetical protein
VGPAFTIIVLLIVATVATAACFVVAKLFLSLRHALILAPLLVASGGVGCIAGLFLQIPFTPEELTSGAQVLRYLGVGLATGVFSAETALWLFLRWRTRRKLQMASTQMPTID